MTLDEIINPALESDPDLITMKLRIARHYTGDKDMNTLKITKADLDADNYYIGVTDVSQEYDGSIEIDADLGTAKFKTSLRAKNAIIALAGSGIQAGEVIKAGDGIEAGQGIYAGLGIKAGFGIVAGDGIKAGWGIEAGTGIIAGTGIKAGAGIVAGSGIKAGDGIKAGGHIDAGGHIVAGLGIEAGWNIKAGRNISAKWIVAKLRIFAGLCSWRLPTEEETEIRAELREGAIAFGKLVGPAEPTTLGGKYD